MPVGLATAALPGLTTLTAAVKVTLWPYTEVLGDVATAVLVFAMLTTCVTLAEAGLATKLLSPLVYAAGDRVAARDKRARGYVASSWPPDDAERARCRSSAVAVERDRPVGTRGPAGWRSQPRPRERHRLARDRGRLPMTRPSSWWCPVDLWTTTPDVLPKKLNRPRNCRDRCKRPR